VCHWRALAHVGVMGHVCPVSPNTGTSYNLNDVRNLYCGNCKVYHEPISNPWRIKMKTLLIGSALLMTVASAQAEIICTQHRGCIETGGRLIYGNGGGVNRQESTVSYRDAKPKKVIFRRHYNTSE
jgi:hypothetical protein